MANKDLAALLKDLEKIARIPKCNGCSCLMDTLKEYQEQIGALPSDDAKELKAKTEELINSHPVTHGCLGCNPCYPVKVSNALYEMGSAESEKSTDCTGASCSEGTTSPRCDSLNETKWPGEPGDYLVGKQTSPLAISTLASPDLAEPIAKAVSFTRVAIVGKTETENIGIEKVVKNIISNPFIRFLILCGQESSGAKGIGHFSGQTLLALHRNGIQSNSRVVGSPGRRPFVKNLLPEHVDQFRRQISIENLIGCEDVETIRRETERLLGSNSKPFSGTRIYSPTPRLQAKPPEKLQLDKAGFLIIYTDPGAEKIVVEHYEYGGKLKQVIEGKDAISLCHTALSSGMVSSLDHTAYLGRELTKAELALAEGRPYVQDRAPGELE